MEVDGQANALDARFDKRDRGQRRQVPPKPKPPLPRLQQKLPNPVPAKPLRQRPQPARWPGRALRKPVRQRPRPPNPWLLPDRACKTAAGQCREGEGCPRSAPAANPAAAEAVKHAIEATEKSKRANATSLPLPAALLARPAPRRFSRKSRARRRPSRSEAFGFTTSGRAIAAGCWTGMDRSRRSAVLRRSAHPRGAQPIARSSILARPRRMAHPPTARRIVQPASFKLD